MDLEEMKYQLEITQQEEYGRQLCCSVIERFLQPPFKITSAKSLPLYSPVDLELTATNMNCLLHEIKLLVEVKCRNKNDRQLKDYPWCELLVSKQKRMKAYSRKNKGSELLYCVLNPEKNKFWIYDINAINFRKINKGVFENNKITEFNPHSEREDQVVYQIPFELAILKGEIYAVPEQTEKEEKTKPLF